MLQIMELFNYLYLEHILKKDKNQMILNMKERFEREVKSDFFH